MDDNRKVAAALAAVSRYLETESAQAFLPAEEVARTLAANRPNIWGASGRQEQMQLRRMMQLRTFR